MAFLPSQFMQEVNLSNSHGTTLDSTGAEPSHSDRNPQGNSGALARHRIYVKHTS